MVTEYVAGYFETIGRNGIADLNDNNSGYDHYNGGNDGKDSRARFVKKKKRKTGTETLLHHHHNHHYHYHLDSSFRS